MAERDMTRRVFLGLATAGLGAAAGGVATSLITTNMNQRAAEKQAIEEEQAAVEGDRSNVTTDNVGTSDNAAESIASPQAEPVEIDPAPETPRYDIVDAHLHYVDFLEHTDGFPALCEAMDASGVSQSAYDA